MNNNNVGAAGNNVAKELKKDEKRKITDSIKDNLQKITIAIVSMLYILQGLFTIAKKDTSIWDILGSIGLSIMVGVIISSSMNSMGLKDGRLGDPFIASMKAYGKAKEDATPYFDKLNAWCEYKNFQELEFTKKDIIQSAGLNWKAYKYGYYNEPEHREKLDEKQIKALEQAKYCKIERLTARDLQSDFPQTRKTMFGFKKLGRFGESEKDYKNRNLVSDFFTRVFMSVICGLYTLKPLWDGTNKQEVIAGIIWNTLQIMMWIALGTIKYVNAKQFIEVDYRQSHIIQKTEYLNEFTVTMKNNPDVIENFDETIEIDKYIEAYIKEKEELENGTTGTRNNEKESSEEGVLD